MYKRQDKLRAYEAVLRAYAKKVAANAAEALFMNEAKAINEKRPCTLEFLLKNAFGEVCHPNAARYMLYLAKIEIDKRVRTATAYLNNVILPRLELYAPDAYDTGMHHTFLADISRLTCKEAQAENHTLIIKRLLKILSLIHL